MILLYTQKEIQGQVGFSTHVRVRVSSCLKIYLLLALPIYTLSHCISISMVVILTGRHSLRVSFGPEACAFLSCVKLARNWVEKILSLAGLFPTVNLHSCERANATNTN